MELCGGKSLQQILADRGRLTEDEIRPLMIQFLGGVKFMAKRNILHRDLKPSNLFVTADGHLQIGDFGLGTWLKPGRRRFDPHPPGTLQYMAPETLSASEGGYEREVDLWAVGAIMYESLVGIPPFSADTESAIIRNILNRRYGWPDGEVSDEAQEAVSGLLDLEERRATEDETVQLLFFSAGDYPECPLSPCSKSSPGCPGPGAEHNLRCYRWYCQQAGVGKTEHGDFWPCVGNRNTKPSFPNRDPRGGKYFSTLWEWEV